MAHPVRTERTKTEAEDIGPRARRAMERLHSQCAVYTNESFAPRLLKASGWTAKKAASGVRLLEPGVGEGALLLCALRELCSKIEIIEVDFELLKKAFLGFEIDEKACAIARHRLVAVLRQHGLAPRKAAALARAWVRRADFLTEYPVPVFDCCIANPPYVRWRAVPRLLRARYAKYGFEGTDLSLAFMSRAVEWLTPGGRGAFLCNDRWPYAVHGAKLRDSILEKASLLSYERVHIGERAYVRKVGAYAALSVLKKLKHRPTARREERTRLKVEAKLPRGLSGNKAQRLFTTLCERLLPFDKAGCLVRVGPAFGHSSFKVALSHDLVKAQLAVPVISGSDIDVFGRAQPRNAAIFAIDATEAPIDPRAQPLLQRHLSPHARMLEKRACVKSGSRKWYEPIDRLRWRDILDEKLLVAGIAKRAKIAHDSTGQWLPSNGVYMIRSSVWPYVALARLLRSGLLDLVCDAVAPQLAGKARRYQASVIRSTPLPDWGKLRRRDRETIDALDVSPSELRDVMERVLGVDVALEPHVEETAL